VGGKEVGVAGRSGKGELWDSSGDRGVVWCGVCIVVLYCFHMGSQGFGAGVIQTSINKMVHLVCMVIDTFVTMCVNPCMDIYVYSRA